MSRAPVAAALLLAVVAIAWGAIPLIVRGDVPWQQLAAARVWLGAATLLTVLALRGNLRVPTVHRWRIAVSGTLLAVHWASFFLAITETTVAIALAVLYLGPVTASALAPRLLGERVRPQVYVGLALAFGGVLMVVRPSGDTSAAGLVAAVVSGATIAALMLVAKPAAEALGGLVFAAGKLSVAAVVLAPWAFVAARDSAEHWPELLVLGVLLTGIANVVYWRGMKLLPVAGVSVLMYLEPASAVVWAMLFLEETPDLLAWAGIALIVAGGVLAAGNATRAEEEIVVPAAL